MAEQSTNQNERDLNSDLTLGSSSRGGNLLSTQLSLGTSTSQRSRVSSALSTPRNRRSDIQSTGALERYLSGTGALNLSSVADPYNATRSAAAFSSLSSVASDAPIPALGRPGLGSDLGGLGSSSSSLGMDPTTVREIIWGTNVNIEESMAMFRQFILNFTKADRIRHENPNDMIDVSDEDREPFYNLLLRQLKETETYSMNLDCANLAAYEPSVRLYHQLLRYPQEIIPLMDHVLTDLFLERFDDVDLAQDDAIRVRPFNLGRSTNLRELNPSDIDQLITVKGLLIRSSPVIPDLKTAFFRCSACDHTISVDNDRGRINEPTRCPSAECKTKNSMRLIHNRCVFSDKQILRLQETPDETPDGQTPYTVSMCVYDELVDVAKPGDRLEITGIFRGIPVRVNPRQRAIKSLFRTYVDVVHIKRIDEKRLGVDASAVAENEARFQFDESDEIRKETPDYVNFVMETAKRPDLYSLLSRSVAPSIFGMEDVKKGVLLQLFGGANKTPNAATGTPRIRGDINILLVGDPGVSKSQLLQYVHKLAPRGVYTSGKGSSAVGLTAYVTRDPDTRQIVLESGALVLSDGGICCIDEFDKMSDTTRSVLHEVMEQQTISIAKAGIITTLNARTSILACANPINSKFDVNLSVPENVNLPPPLMSRFDLLYLILDKPDPRDDRRLAQHLVSLYLDNRPRVSEQEFITIEQFTQYVNYAKTINPVISEEAGQALVNFYVAMRKAGMTGTSHAVTFTTRQLESMIRLSEAHARMRLSATVDKEDVEEANRLVLTALQTAAIDPRTGRIDLDLVTTGISARDRQFHDQKRRAVRSMIDGVDKPSMKWSEAYRQFISQSDVPVSESEFNSILKDLMDENFIHVSGRTMTDKIIRKLR